MTTQEKDVQAPKKLQKSYFDVLGLCCTSEVPLIESILKSLDGVKEYSVIVPTRTVIVVHDNLIISQLQIVKALNQARLEANVRAYGGTDFRKKWPSPYAIACGVLLALSFLKHFYHPLRWLAIGAVAVGICPVALKAFAAVRSFRLDINTLMLIAVIGTIALKDYTEAGTIVFLFTVAEWLETRASHKANAVMSALMSITPQKAIIAETGEEVDANEVKLNTVLAVKAGEVVPIDGIVVDGKCEVDEKTLTGESYPVAKQKDSSVWAGTINLNGYVSVKTTALTEDCVVAKMAKLVEEAQNGKSKTQRFIDKCSQYYTPAVIIISVCLAVIPAALRVPNRNHWFHLALVVLVSACPCALILSTPVVTFCALTKAATSGLLIKGGDYLEILAKVKVMAFDKTGTITRGEFFVSDFRSLSDDINVDTLLYWVSSIESKSSHPMATALVEYGKSLSIEPKPESVEDYQNFPGEGIYGKIGGEGIYIGNRKIALRAGCVTVPSVEGIKMKGGNTIGYIYTGESLVGVFSLSDACRTGVAEAIRELKLLGIKTAMLTGDSQAAAMHAQEQLGNCLEAVHSELLPQDKAKMIGQFKREGPTSMIGDGVNDAPALATADIGISMGISGSALATETGHVILMSNDLRRVPEAIHLARKAHRKVIENIILSIATKAAILALAIDGHPLVWAAVLADVGTCLLVISNSMLILRGTHKRGSKGFKSSVSSHTRKHGGKCCDSSAPLHSHKHEGHSCTSSAEAHTHKHGRKCFQSSASLHTHKHGGKICKSSAPAHSHGHGGKCCQSSLKSPTQKHGCDSDTFHSSHNKQHCCSDNRAQKVSETTKQISSHGCAPRSCRSNSCSSNSCGKNELKGSAERHSGCEYTDKTYEGKDDCDHGNCNTDNHDIEAQKTHIHGCSGHHNSSLCANNTCPKEAPDNPVEDCGSSKAKHCDHHGHCYSETHDNNPNHLSHYTSLVEERIITNHGHCHQVHSSKKHLINQTDLELGKVIESICCHQHQSPKATVAFRQCCSYHDTEGHHVESPTVAMNACISLENREIGGCCKSYYMKQCCGKHGHLGAGLGGGLTEIITE